jgi:hypothetical protein
VRLYRQLTVTDSEIVQTAVTDSEIVQTAVTDSQIVHKHQTEKTFLILPPPQFPHIKMPSIPDLYTSHTLLMFIISLIPLQVKVYSVSDKNIPSFKRLYSC